MSNYGQWEIDDAITFAVNTHDPTDGMASDADSVPTYRIYEDETGTAISTGSMALLDGTNTTGFYSERISLTSAAGYEVGKSYTIYIQATVNSVTGTTHHNFQVVNGALTAADVNAEVVDVLRTDTIPDSYATDGSQPTIAQAILMIQQFLMEKSVSGTTLTVNKPDGSTSAMTFTLDDGSTPTSITRAS